MIVSWLAAACLLLSSQAAARQVPLSSNSSASTSNGVHHPNSDSATQHQHQHQQQHFQQSTRGLSGRFLHVTDFHPDPHYKIGSAISSGCHSKKPKKEKARAGYWGSPVSGCDSPTHLVEASMDWIKDNWLPSKRVDADDPTRSPFDFIIWTGDSARHDLDSKYPRTRKEIYDLNKWSLQLLQSRFPRTPIVPTIGNNDIFPHNILWPGPNDVTSAYSQIWADVIPEYQLHTFQLGGYFSLDAIPGRLAVISMNTIYWYDSNKVVDGCKNAKKRRAKRGRKGKGKAVREASDGDGDDDDDDDDVQTSSADHAHATLKSRDPGTMQLEWLEAQLEQYRKRGMHVHLIGHVPPTAGNYFEECYEVYTDIVLHQQQTVIGQHFGHMNVDAFFVQEDSEAVRREDKKKHKNKPRRQGYEGDDDVAKNVTTSLNPSSFSDDLRKDYAIFPGQGRTNASYYHYFFEAPSIVPTYLPSIRVWTYNVSGVTVGEPGVVAAGQDETLGDMEALAQTSLSLPSTPRSHFDTLRRKHRRPKHRHRNKVRLPRYTDADSPVRSNQPLSLLGYSQWVLNLDEANGKQQRGHAAARSPLNFGLEYATYTPETLWGDLVSSSNAAQDLTTVSPSPRSPAPVPRHLLERELSKRNVHPDDLATSARHKLKLPKPIRHLTEYALPHITVDEMLRLARRLAVDDSLWKRFERRVYTESGVED